MVQVKREQCGGNGEKPLVKVVPDPARGTREANLLMYVILKERDLAHGPRKGDTILVDRSLTAREGDAVVAYGGTADTAEELTFGILRRTASGLPVLFDDDRMRCCDQDCAPPRIVGPIVGTLPKSILF